LQLANGGYSHQVQVVKGAAPHDHGPRILAEDTVARIKKMMRKVVSNRGTGRLGQVKGVEVAGKTGTTHVYTDKGYAEERYVASFSGFAPLAEPKYVITVVLEEPDKARHYGGQVAAPVFAKILFNLLYLEAR
jgi:cell division protein FtsI (penicillin-binding protein 3)